jgi:diguanylate cyclase (GGDEF)-like protein/PAS domain S-box-containing protein
LSDNDLQNPQYLASAIYDNAGLLVVLLDAEGRIVRFNRACERVSGYSLEEVRGKTPWETVLPPEEAETVRREAFASLIDNAEDEASYYTNNWLTRDGEYRLIEWTNTLMHDEQGQQYVVAMGMDVTGRKQSEDVLRKSRQQLVEAQRIARMGSWSLDLKKNQLEWSDEIFNLFEIDKEKFGASYEAFLDAIHPEDRDMVNQAYTDSLSTKKPYEIDHRLLFSDGRIKHVREACESLYDDDGNPILSRGTVQDITEQKEAERQIKLYASVFLNSPEAILITDENNCIIAINPALTELTGYTFEELEGVNPNILASGLSDPETYVEMADALDKDGYWQGELIDRKKDGTVYPKWTTVTAIRDENEQLTNQIISFLDITERKSDEERIHYLAHHDTLTGLFNRYSMENRLDQAIMQARREQGRLALLFIDLDRFKAINDSLGHQVGDQLLIQVAKRLQSSIRESDILARLGGDEFLVAITNIDDSMAATTVADKLLERLGRVYEIEGHELRSSPSIGISVFPEDGDDVETLMKSADAAMYHAKEQGRNNYQFFTAEMNSVAQELIALEADLRTALALKQFELYYQPKYEARDGRLSGVEALIRWNHPERGLISPMKFIPVAEEVDLISELGEWVLNEACRQLAQWRSKGHTDLVMSVNLSPRQLRNPGLVDRMKGIMEAYGLGGGMLEMEVTETAAMSHTDFAIEQLEAIRDAGVDLAIDDFGTGYSSLSYLRSLPIQTLKVDRSFVSGIEEDPNDAAICAATIALAHELGLKVVAEGVETEAHRNFLIEHKCDSLQGYLLSRPLPSDEVEKLF